MEVLNKKSGLLGISCLSSDGRDLEDAAAEGNAEGSACALTFSTTGLSNT